MIVPCRFGYCPCCVIAHSSMSFQCHACYRQIVRCAQEFLFVAVVSYVATVSRHAASTIYVASARALTVWAMACVRHTCKSDITAAWQIIPAFGQWRLADVCGGLTGKEK